MDSINSSTSPIAVTFSSFTEAEKKVSRYKLHPRGTFHVQFSTPHPDHLDEPGKNLKKEADIEGFYALTSMDALRLNKDYTKIVAQDGDGHSHNIYLKTADYNDHVKSLADRAKPIENPLNEFQQVFSKINKQKS